MDVPEAKAANDKAACLHVTLAALLQDWKGAYERARRYMAALGTDGDRATDVAARAAADAAALDEWPAGGDSFTQTLSRLRGALCGGEGARDPQARFLEWRLARALGRQPEPTLRGPPIGRVSMVPHHIEQGRLRGRLVSSGKTGRTADAAAHPSSLTRAGQLRQRWERVALRRRALLLLLISIPTVIASQFMVEVLPYQGRTPLELAIVAFFGTLFGWISIGFWTALVGFFILISRRDRFRVSAEIARGDPIDARARTAIVMPICEEPVDRVFAGLQAMYRSLEQTGHLAAFDFFVLSDSADPSTWVKEEEAWLDWCRTVGGFGRVFYRRRRVRIERKSGNIADFCRRFGRRYRYMITLDADSLMAGETLVRLVQLMESHPSMGLAQTLPVPIHARSLYARIQQFANRLYGPLFATGMHFWQLGDAQYWGHNAIVRLAPFIRYCGLPRLPGKPPFGGEILSHDFVEAAMLGSAGYSVWLVYDLPGSYEELPSSLLEDLHRDRRWCQGNFQHLRLLFVRGLFPVHRALFVNGALSYVSALLWLCFLSLSTAEAVLQIVRVPEYFPAERALFPQWPVWHPAWALSLFTVTMMILFLPKALGAILVIERGEQRSFGGVFRFLVSVVLETLASSLYAPIRMVFHSKFVLTNLLGRVVAWRSPPRGDHETTWGEALRYHTGATLLACAWGGGVYWVNPQYFWWLTPILTALVLSVPLSVWMSRLRLGDAARQVGLFLTPEQTHRPPELAHHAEALAAARGKERGLSPSERDGVVRAVVDPYVNALHRWLLREPRPLRPSIREVRSGLVERALAEGPTALDLGARRALLSDPSCVDELHRRVWQLSSGELARAWGRPGGELPERDKGT
jgi:membrane glycosyltransferase